MAKLDDLKNKLGVPKLDKDAKSDLYKDFKNIGGKVVEVYESEEDKAKRLSKAIQNKSDYEAYMEEQEEKSRAIKAQKAAYRSKLAEAASRQDEKDSSKQALPSHTATKKHNPFIDRLVAKIMGYINGVTALFSDRMNENFLKITTVDLKDSLQNSKRIMASVFHQDLDMCRNIRDRLKAIARDYYFEVLYRYDEIYEQLLFEELTILKLRKKQLSEGKANLIKLFKKLYALANYRLVMLDALSSIFNYEKQMKGLDAGVVDSNIRYVKNHIEFLYLKYYPKIYLIMQYYFTIERSLHPNKTFEEFIDLKDEDRVGFLSKKWMQEDEEEKKRIEREEEEKLKRAKENIRETHKYIDDLGSEFIPEKEGLQFIYDNIRFEEILARLKEGGSPWGYCKLNERAFLIYSLIDFFDKEFSFIYVSNKIHYNIFVDKKGVKWDIHKRLKEAFFQLESVYQKTRNYEKVLSELNALSTNKDLIDTRNLPEFARLNGFREQTLALIIVDSRKCIEIFLKIFEFIFADPKGFENFIKNGEENFFFENEVDKSRLTNNKTIVEIFRTAYFFLSGLYFLLSDGDLSGYALFIKIPRYLNIRIEDDDKPEDLPPPEKVAEEIANIEDEIKTMHEKLNK